MLKQVLYTQARLPISRSQEKYKVENAQKMASRSMFAKLVMGPGRPGAVVVVMVGGRSC